MKTTIPKQVTICDECLKAGIETEVGPELSACPICGLDVCVEHAGARVGFVTFCKTCTAKHQLTPQEIVTLVIAERKRRGMSPTPTAFEIGLVGI